MSDKANAPTWASVRRDKEQIRRRIQTERDVAKRNLDGELRRMIERLTQAHEALDKGDKLDPHLIVNAGSMTYDIARWNVSVDLLPYVNDADALEQVQKIGLDTPHAFEPRRSGSRWNGPAAEIYIITAAQDPRNVIRERWVASERREHEGEAKEVNIERLPVTYRAPFDCINANEGCPGCRQRKSDHGVSGSLAIYAVRTEHDGKRRAVTMRILGGDVLPVTREWWRVTGRGEDRPHHAAGLEFHREDLDGEECGYLGDGRLCVPDVGYCAGEELFRLYGNSDSASDVREQPEGFWLALERALLEDIFGKPEQVASS